MANSPAESPANANLPSVIRTGQTLSPRRKAAIANMEGLRTFLNGRADIEDGPEKRWEIAAMQLSNIFEARTLAEMWMADMEDTEGGRDLIGVEMTILDYSVHRSTKYKAGIPTGRTMDNNGDPISGNEYFWILVTAAKLETGEEILWNTGAPGLIGKVIALEKYGTLGKTEAQAVIVGQEAENGTVLKLGPVTRRATPATSESAA